jgi:6-phosphofructokinase 1
LYELGLPVVGVPKTIDNDLSVTDRTFGFDSAVAVVTRSLDRLHSTAESHHRVMIVETMGRWAGWLALAGGAGGGADVILIPEISYHPSRIAETLAKRERLGKRYTILAVAEGAAPTGGEATVSEVDPLRPEAIRLGGVGFRLAEQLEELHGQECRVVVLGHLQRAGPPVASDRNLATLFGIKAVELALQGGRGRMAALHGSDVVDVSLADAVAAPRRVSPDHPLVTAARAVGTDFGD